MLSQDRIKPSLFEGVNDPDVEGDMMVGEKVIHWTIPGTIAM